MKWASLSTAERQLAYIWGGLALAIVALKPLWAVVMPHLRPCLFHSLTGIPCPSCGGTRCVLALLDGRLLDAVSFNPLVFAVSLAFFAGGLVAPLWAWRRGTAPRLGRPLPLWVRFGLVLVIIANWGWLIATL
jgi:hypothetical protein